MGRRINPFHGLWTLGHGSLRFRFEVRANATSREKLNSHHHAKPLANPIMANKTTTPHFALGSAAVFDTSGPSCFSAHPNTRNSRHQWFRYTGRGWHQPMLHMLGVRFWRRSGETHPASNTHCPCTAKSSVHHWTHLRFKCRWIPVGALER